MPPPGSDANEQQGVTDSRFWMLINPALPIGGYSFSHGMESAIEAGLVDSSDSATRWIKSLGRRALPSLELPLLARLLDGFESADVERINYWNDLAHASRETSELLLEECEKGRALRKLYPALGIEPELELEALGFSGAFAEVCHSWKISKSLALRGFGWIWYEMLVTAAVKLVPLGHSDGQRLLLELHGTLDELVEQALQCSDLEIGASAPGLAGLSAAHENQAARVFRS